MFLGDRTRYEEYRFFDAQDNIESVSDSVSKPTSNHDLVFNGFEYDVWVRTPTSVQDRKNQFLKLMSLSLDDEIQSDDSGGFDKRMMEASDAVLRSPIYEEMSSSTSSVSDSSTILLSREDFVCRGKILNCGKSCKEDEGGCNSLIHGECDSPPLVQKLVERQIKVAGTMARTMNRVKSQWLSRLRSMTCVVDRQGRCDGLGDGRRSRVQRVRVRQNKKRLKELSAVFIGQDIQAHQCSILTMKFSRDGRYLATAGEDGYSLCITY